MGKIVLVTGGARSGKSAFAERYAAKEAERSSCHVAYIATAEALDEGMKFRVKLHRERRSAAWTTFESPWHAERAILEAGKEHGIILFDCITMYLSNLLCAENLWNEEARAYRETEEAMCALVSAAESISGAVIFVTNEVGGGIVPADALSRIYRDLSGLSNQWIGRAAHEVYLVTCGLAIDLKKIGEIV